MELIREYLIISFLFKQERKKKELIETSLCLYGGYVKPTPSNFREYSPEMVRKEVYKLFGKEGGHVCG